MDKYHINAFHIDDYADACRLWEATEGVTLNESDSYEAIKSFLVRNPGYGYTIRTLQGECIGTVLCGHNGRAGHIYHLTVKESHRGQGLATHLVNLCLKKLGGDSIPRCNIFVYSENQEGSQFWLKSNWDDPEHWKIMQKII